MTALANIVAQKKALLGELLAEPMRRLAEQTVLVWPDADAIDGVLRSGFTDLPHCHLLYALDIGAVQISSNVLPAETQTRWRSQILSERPYLEGSLPYQGFILSRAYLSFRGSEPCITAVQAVRHGDSLLGFIAADFNIYDLPETGLVILPAQNWQQFKGDPAIRGTLFMQQRARSLMDERMDEVLPIMQALLRQYGIFHGKLHFSSSRFTLWHVDDPFSYRLHAGDEIVSPDLCLAYRKCPYPPNAKLAPEWIGRVLEQFRALREADETVYLRSGSINIINGMVWLNFSCDGSHYMRADEFLDREVDFWMGLPSNPADTCRP